MAGSEIKGKDFENALYEYIKSWNEPLEVLFQVNVGQRFVGTPRRLDLVIRNTTNNKYVGIECKIQFSEGTAYEKFSYALEDCKTSPIPTILAFAGTAIRDDMKAHMIMSGCGIELGIVSKNGTIEVIDKDNIFRQRCYIELGLNWFPFATGTKIGQQLASLK